MGQFILFLRLKSEISAPEPLILLCRLIPKHRVTKMDCTHTVFLFQPLPRSHPTCPTHLSSECAPLDVLLLLLGYGNTQHERVDATGHSGDQDDGREAHGQRQETGEAEEGLPADRVAGLVEAGKVQAQVAEDLGSNEHPEGVGHQAAGDPLGQHPEAAQQVDRRIGHQPHRRHSDGGQLVAGVDDGTHDDHIAVEESGEGHQHKQRLVPLPSEVGLVEVLQGFGGKGQPHEAWQAQATARAAHCDLVGPAHRLARV